MPPPRIHVRWFHSAHGVPHLDLLAMPSVKAPSNNWVQFTRDESDRCEEAWEAFNHDLVHEEDQIPNEQVPVKAVIDTDDENLTLGVPIGKERLFEVDVRAMKVSI